MGFLVKIQNTKPIANNQRKLPGSNCVPEEEDRRQRLRSEAIGLVTAGFHTFANVIAWSHATFISAQRAV